MDNVLYSVSINILLFVIIMQGPHLQCSINSFAVALRYESTIFINDNDMSLEYSMSAPQFGPALCIPPYPIPYTACKLYSCNNLTIHEHMLELVSTITKLTLYVST
jgi:hypothetical protein